MAMVNMNNLLNGKDSRWLQLEVCREFQRNKCTRPDTECKFAHPPANVEVQNGRVTACYDSIKVTNNTLCYIIEFSPFTGSSSPDNPAFWLLPWLLSLVIYLLSIFRTLHAFFTISSTISAVFNRSNATATAKNAEQRDTSR